jgi:hypothetical protein
VLSVAIWKQSSSECSRILRFYRVNFEVSNRKPFSHLAFPAFQTHEISLEMPSFDGELMAGCFLGIPKVIAHSEVTARRGTEREMSVNNLPRTHLFAHPNPKSPRSRWHERSSRRSTWSPWVSGAPPTSASLQDLRGRPERYSHHWRSPRACRWRVDDKFAYLAPSNQERFQILSRTTISVTTLHLEDKIITYV